MASDVYDSFYELFLYEALEQLISRHHTKQSPLSDLLRDVESVGSNLGRKAIDLLIRDQPIKY